MKKSVKHFIVGLFACVGCACALLPMTAANKEVATAGAATASFEMLGASVRRKGPDGIRFVAQIDSATFSSYGEGKRYGMVVVPEDLADANITVSYTGGAYVVSDTDAIAIEGGELWSETLCQKYGVTSGYDAFSCALVAGPDGEESEVVQFPVSLYNRPLTAFAFVIPENASTVYTQRLTRSISYVAMLESMSGDYEESETVENIVDGVATTLSVGSGTLTDKTAVAPTFKIGGVTADASSMMTVAYTSNNAGVAKIVDGKVVAVADGEATITATATVAGGKTYTKTAKVTVALQKYTITATASPTAGGSVSGGGTFTVGDTVTLTATSKTGYNFVGWYDGETKVSSNATYSFPAAANKAYTAKWEAIQYVVSATQNIKNAGTVTGAKQYAYNTSATLTATPATNYAFVGWYNGSTKVSDNATYSFTVKEDVSLTAKFSAMIGMDTEYWATHGNVSISNGSVNFAGPEFGHSVYTKAKYTNFILEFDVVGLGNTWTANTWFGVMYGATVTAPVYNQATNNCIYFDRRWGTIMCYDTQPSQHAAVSQLIDVSSAHVKMVVQGGEAVVILTLGDATITSTPIACMSGLTTNGYIGLIMCEGSTATMQNISLIDLDGRDFNPTPTAVKTAIKDLKTAGKVKIDGRTHFDGNNALVLRNSASGFEVYTTSSQLTMNYSVSATPATEYLKVWVDGVEKVLTLTATSATDVVLAGGMQAGVQHHIKVAKMNEAYNAVRDQSGAATACNIYVNSLTCLSNGTIEAAPTAKDLKIELFGDSISCGYGINDTSANLWYAADKEDATSTFAYQTAQALDADINVVAHQGWGIMRTNNNSMWGDANLALNFSITGCFEPPINATWVTTEGGGYYDINYKEMSSESELIQHAGIWDKTTDVADTAYNPNWDFSAYVPDIVIISLGTNDHVNYRTGNDYFTRYVWSYVNFIYNLNNKYKSVNPNANIKYVLCHGMMDSAGRFAEALSYIHQICSNSVAGVDYSAFLVDNIVVDLTGADGSYMSGGGGHPNKAEHTTAAANLQAALRNAGWIS